jgi:hypothetical protein
MAQHHARAIARSKLPADVMAIADPQATTVHVVHTSRIGALRTTNRCA